MEDEENMLERGTTEVLSTFYKEEALTGMYIISNQTGQKMSAGREIKHGWGKERGPQGTEMLETTQRKRSVRPHAPRHGC